MQASEAAGQDVSAVLIARPAGSGAAGPDDNPELADIGRLARRLVRRGVAAARAQDAPTRRLLRDHLGPAGSSLPVVARSWPRYDHVNVQAGLDAWLAAPGRRHQLAGLTGFRHQDFGLADLIQPARYDQLGVGSVATVVLPAGPAGETRACVQCGLYLIEDAGTRIALLLRGPEEHGSDEVHLEVCGADQATAERVLDEVGQLTAERNVFRGQVVTFGGEVFGHVRGALLSFLPRPRIDRAQVILPRAVLDGIERQVLGIARHASALAASGQHLKRGVLLHGAPGTGKTHTIRYLLGQLPGTTVIVISGYGLRWIAEACSVARTLQPSVVVIEDVDLIAEERGARLGENPMLFQLLNEMDGLGEDIDVTFLLTTNRADLLEPALAARPGRVDHAAELPVPDAEARRRLIGLYRGSLVLELADMESVLARTDGVTASFLKELLRRAALVAAEESDRPAPRPGGGAAPGAAPGAEPAAGPLHVTDAHVGAALDQLLDIRSQLTRSLLGGHALGGAGDSLEP